MADLRTWFKAPGSLPNLVKNSKPITPKQNSIVSHSHYNTTIDKSPGRVQGNSRAWGDASYENRAQVIDELLSEAHRRSLSRKDAAFFSAVGFVESGFNPDAAAASTTASGVGQFVKKTGEACGVSIDEAFDYKESIKGLFRYMGGILNKVRSSEEFLGVAKDDPRIYVEAYSMYHDGAKVKPETREFTEKRVTPVQDEFVGWLEVEDAYEEAIEPSYQIETEREKFPKCTL